MEQIIKELVILGKKKSDSKYKEVEHDKDKGKSSIPNLISGEKEEEEEYDEMSSQNNNNNQVLLQEAELGENDYEPGVGVGIIEMMDVDEINNNNLVSKIETKQAQAPPSPSPQQVFGSRLTLGTEIQKLGPPKILTAQNDGSILYKTSSGQTVLIPGELQVNIEPIPECLVRMYLPKASLENHKALAEGWGQLQDDDQMAYGLNGENKDKSPALGWSALQDHDYCLNGVGEPPLKLANNSVSNATTTSTRNHPMQTRSQLQKLMEDEENDEDAKKSKGFEDKGRKATTTDTPVPYQQWPVVGVGVEEHISDTATFTKQPNGTILYKSASGTRLLPEVRLRLTRLQGY